MLRKSKPWRYYVALISCALSSTVWAETADAPYTLLNAEHYQHIVTESRAQIRTLLTQLAAKQHASTNEKITYIVQALSDIPYSERESIGEGDWQPQSRVYQPGAVHLNQNPVYRLDYFDCQTFVEVAMALLYAHTLDQFDQQFLAISYGAAGNPNGDIVRYYNRNNFADGDMNPINEKNGFFTDVTATGNLAHYAAYTSATIERQNWFRTQTTHPHHTVQVLNTKNGAAMVERFQTLYTHLDFPHFKAETVRISYLPKHAIAVPQADGSFAPNQAVLDSIPTPAVAEIISNTKQWDVGGKNIKDIIGTELNVPHMGILYRHTFQHGEIDLPQNLLSWQLATGIHLHRDSCLL